MQATAVFYQPSLPQKLQENPTPSQQPGVQQTMQLRFIPATVHLCKAEEDSPVARHRQPTLSAADCVEDRKVEARSVTKSVCLLLCLALGEISLVQGCLNPLQVCNDHSQKCVPDLHRFKALVKGCTVAVATAGPTIQTKGTQSQALLLDRLILEGDWSA